MKRFIIFRNDVSHGTVLLIKDFPYYITSHPLDDALGVEYFLSRSGLRKDGLRVVSRIEVTVPAKGIAMESVSPYLYEIECEEPK